MNVSTMLNMVPLPHLLFFSVAGGMGLIPTLFTKGWLLCLQINCIKRTIKLFLAYLLFEFFPVAFHDNVPEGFTLLFSKSQLAASNIWQ